MKQRTGLLVVAGLFVAAVAAVFVGCEVIDDSFNIGDRDNSNHITTYVYTNSSGDVVTNTLPDNE